MTDLKLRLVYLQISSFRDVSSWRHSGETRVTITRIRLASTKQPRHCSFAAVLYFYESKLATLHTRNRKEANSSRVCAAGMAEPAQKIKETRLLPSAGTASSRWVKSSRLLHGELHLMRSTEFHSWKYMFLN